MASTTTQQLFLKLDFERSMRFRIRVAANLAALMCASGSASCPAGPTTMPASGSLVDTVPTEALDKAATRPESHEAAASRQTTPLTFPVPPTMPAVPMPIPVTLPTLPPRPATRPAETEPTTSAATTEPGRREGGAEQLGSRTITAVADRTGIDIAPSIGAQQYTVGPSEIANIPGGQNASFQQVLARAPGVAVDSFGQEHVRGEHGNLTYCVNGVLLPQSTNVFGQEIDTRLVGSVALIDGTLPAQYGLHTAGIVNITTKSGDSLNHNELSVYGGSYDTLQPSLELAGTRGKLDYFIAISDNHNGLGIENTTGSHVALHDYTDQQRIFAYFSYAIDDTSRLSIFANNYYGNFEIPATNNVPPAFALNGHSATNSGNIDENQNEQEYYLVVAYQKTVDKLSYQLSGYTRYAQITYVPDYVNDLIYQGVAGGVYNNYITYGVQLDSTYVLNEVHTIRAGLVADYTGEKEDTTTAAFPIATAGAQSSSSPLYIPDHSGNTGIESGIYLQDEWKLTKSLTFNYGVRYDRFDSSFDSEDQVSPRASMVWKVDESDTVHAGYSRYFVPPPILNLDRASITKYAGTTNAAPNLQTDPARVERSNYYDVGVTHQFSKEFSVSIDGFYKQAKQLIDLGQFGAPIIFSPFNYRGGTVYSAEMSANYKAGWFSGFANFAWLRTQAHDIDSQEYAIPNDELAYIKTHNIYLDHDATYTISAGAAYAWPHDRVYIDFIYGSGLRSGFANTRQEPQYYPINLGYERVFHGGFWGSNVVRFRADIINVIDQSYQLRQGGGLGVNANQFGQRRSFYTGVTYEF